MSKKAEWGAGGVHLEPVSAPMTDRRLAELRWRTKDVPDICHSQNWFRELFAEIDRLRAVVAAYEQAEKRERERAEIYGQ